MKRYAFSYYETVEVPSLNTVSHERQKREVVLWADRMSDAIDKFNKIYRMYEFEMISITESTI
jgi:hypothetical protein